MSRMPQTILKSDFWSSCGLRLAKERESGLLINVFIEKVLTQISGGYSWHFPIANRRSHSETSHCPGAWELGISLSGFASAVANQGESVVCAGAMIGMKRAGCGQKSHRSQCPRHAERNFEGQSANQWHNWRQYNGCPSPHSAKW